MLGSVTYTGCWVSSVYLKKKCACACEVRGQLAGVGSLLPLWFLEVELRFSGKRLDLPCQLTHPSAVCLLPSVFPVKYGLSLKSRPTLDFPSAGP